MDYFSEQRKQKHVVGIGVVILMHIVLGWALLNGLARKVVEVIKAPIETKIIEEVKPPPPPPPENLPPPPKMAAPPPSFVPPPEVRLANPPPQAATITVTRDAPPQQQPVTLAPPPQPAAKPEPVVAAPPPPQPAPAPKVKPVPGRIANLTSCVSNDDYPAAALRAEATGVSEIRLHVDAGGHVTKAEILTPSGSTREHRMLDKVAIEKLSAPSCSYIVASDDTGHKIASYVTVQVVWKTDN